MKQNGDVVTFVDGVLDDKQTLHIETDELLIDGNTSDDIGNLVLKDREMLGENGIVILSCTLSKETKEIVAGPEVLTRGFIYVKEHQDVLEETKEIVKSAIEENIFPGENKVDYTKIKNDVRDLLGKYYYKMTESKPMIITVIQEI